MEKNFILDTNVLLYDPNAINQFGQNNVIIPVEVIEELDSFKRNITELGQNSRTTSSYLDQLSQKGKLGKGVKLVNEGTLRIYAGEEDCEDYLAKRGLGLNKKVDNRILNLAISLSKKNADQRTVIISKNINLRLKADAVGVYAEDYGENQSAQSNNYPGFYELPCQEDLINAFQDDGSYKFDEKKFLPNEYILLTGGDGKKLSGLGRIDGEDGRNLIRIAQNDKGVLGIKPLDLGQTFALDALLNDDIKLVTLHGKAGTGKTLLAIAAGLHKVLIEDKYNKLLISRPTMPMGRDIGFIPGDVEEKMRPWMQPIYDAVEMISEQDRRSRKRVLPADIMESDDLGIEPLTYIRGRSIPNRYFIIDEAQNLTPHEVKTIITRIGHNSKVVLTGDPEQIDNPYVDLTSNGFSYLAERFRTREISAHIKLSKGERSELAEIAANLL